jgi:ATP-dependent DNA helicase DinG
MTKLKRWAVIDVETTGVDAARDSLIDVGFLLFEGTNLIKSFSSLVRYEGQLSQFIQKLTGIKNSQVHRAPELESLHDDLAELEGADLIAHNASFEQSFLTPVFEDFIGLEDHDFPRFRDSIPYLGLLFAGRSHLGLESFIVDLKLADLEVHRGLEDSRDLLKVLCLATYLLKQGHLGHHYEQFLSQGFQGHGPMDLWFDQFLELSTEELTEISEQIDLNLEESCQKYLSSLDQNRETVDLKNEEKRFPKFSGDSIREIFEDEEALSEKLGHYKLRQSQIDMALRVGQSFHHDLHGLIQAPTGTGKTLGYLIPAAIFSKNYEEKVLIATGTKALQAQAQSKDIPLMRKILGWDESDLKVTKLVGSSNHLCELAFRNQIEEAQGEMNLMNLDKEQENFIKLYLDAIFYLNDVGIHREATLLDDLPYVFKRMFPSFNDWTKRVAVDFRACIGKRCPFVHNCTYMTGILEAQKADVILSNHSMMFSWPRGLNKPKYVVVDEAHRLEGEATEAFGQRVSSDDLNYLVKQIDGFQGVGAFLYLLSKHNRKKYEEMIGTVKEKVESAKSMLADHLGPLAEQIENHFHQLPRFTSQYWNEIPMFQKASLNGTVATAIYNHLSSLNFILRDLLEFFTPLTKMWESSSFVDEDLAAFNRFQTFYDLIFDISQCFSAVLNEDADYASGLKYHVDRGYILENLPINVGEKIHKGLLDTSHSVIFTSATLGLGKGEIGKMGVEWISGYSYLKPEKRFKSGMYLPATFDYQKQCKVFLCNDTPSLYSMEFIEQVLKPISQLVRNLGGKSLLLFSARTRFEKAVEWLLQNLHSEIPVFIQGMGSRVVEDYKNSPSGVLVGMESFGEGIDIPGDGLVFVFIDKVPDLRQDLVIEKRREFFDKTFGNEFENYYLANRCRSLHQKLGRLIRRESDRGGIIVVDSRTKRWKGPTLRKFRKMMEPYDIQMNSLEQATEELADFISQ